MCAASIANTEHPFEPLMKKIEAEKHPILPTLGPSG